MERDPTFIFDTNTNTSPSTAEVLERLQYETQRVRNRLSPAANQSNQSFLQQQQHNLTNMTNPFEDAYASQQQQQPQPPAQGNQNP